jgi:hypothetical protein
MARAETRAEHEQTALPVDRRCDSTDNTEHNSTDNTEHTITTLTVRPFTPPDHHGYSLRQV